MRLRDCQEVAEAADLQALESRLLRIADDLGFGIITGFFVVESSCGETSIRHLGRTPEQFQSQYQSQAVGRRDPVMRRLKRCSAPIVYDQSTYVDENAADLWEVQARYGYKTGITVPLHLPDRQHFVLGVDREEPLPRDDALLSRMVADFNLLAVHTQLAAQRILASQAPDIPSSLPLTKREIEILKWTTEGKSSWAVGRILGISEHTVNFHAQKAMAKLVVSSKHQAAAKARSLGLI